MIRVSSMEQPGQDDEFERLWRQIAEGFTDVPPREIDDEIDRAVSEVRAERQRARERDVAARRRTP